MNSASLEAALAAVENGLAALGASLRERNASSIESNAQDLQRALQRVAQAGLLPAALHTRLALARAEAGAQRDSVARGNATIERALSLLMPASAAPSAYAEQGGLVRSATSGSLAG